MSAQDVTYRWVNGPADDQPTAAEWSRIDDILVERGWMSLNRQTSRVLLAERDGQIVSLFVFQLVPFTGPVWADDSVLGSGVADEMARRMYQFLTECDARGWMAIAESPHTEKLCKQYGMVQVEHPVFVTEVQ